jgi:hypothetical protein
MDAYDEEQIALKKLNDDWKKQQVRMEQARQRCRAERAADLETERIEAEAALNQPPAVPDIVDLSKGIIVNGKFIERQSPPPSIAVVKTAQLTAMNQAALKK